MAKGKSNGKGKNGKGEEPAPVVPVAQTAAKGNVRAVMYGGVEQPPLCGEHFKTYLRQHPGAFRCGQELPAKACAVCFPPQAGQGGAAEPAAQAEAESD